MIHRHRPTWLMCLATCTILAVASRSGIAQEGPPQVQFEQKLGVSVPLDLPFRDEQGKRVTLRDYFGQKPVVLCLVYFECPMLCTLQLNGLVRTMRAMKLSAGEDFTVLTVSFDPGETPQLAARKKEAYLKQYARPGSERGWHFLTGEKDSIEQLTQAVGYEFEYLPHRDEYAHPSGVIVLTPGGKTSRYLYGIEFAPRDLRLALVEAGDGQVGSPVDQVLLLCYGYDPARGEYTLLIYRVLKVAAGLTVLACVTLVGSLLYLERRKTPSLAKTGQEGSDDAD